MSQDFPWGLDGGSQNPEDLGEDFNESQVVWDETSQIPFRTPESSPNRKDVPPPPPAVQGAAQDKAQSQDASDPPELGGLLGPLSLLPDDIGGAGGLPLQPSTERELQLEQKVKELEEGMAAYQQAVYNHGQETFKNCIEQVVQPQMDRLKAQIAALKCGIQDMSQQAAGFVPELQQVREEIEALTNDLRPNPRKDVDTQTDTQTPTQVNGDELISMPATPVTPGGDGARELSSTWMPATPPSPGGNVTLTAPPEIALGVPVELQGERRAQRVKRLRELSDLGHFMGAGEKNQPVDGMRKRPKTAFFGR